MFFIKSLIFLFFITFLSVCQNILAQNNRLNALAGLTLTIPDRDNSLNLYDFGKNPAWLANDQKLSGIEFNSGYSNGHGDYRQYFSASAVSNYFAEFRKIHDLGRAGVFSGTASYSYEIRDDYNESIQYFPYSGEGFFVSDNTSGKFTYSGPQVSFEHSYKIIPQILFGASVDYRILDGLKKEYSMPHSSFRAINLVGGVAVKFSDRISGGITYQYNNALESIESNSTGLSDVEILIFRGEKNAIKRRGSSISEKIQKQKNRIGLQLFANPVENFEAGFNGSYSVSGSGLLLVNSQNIDYEDSYSNFENVDLDFRFRYFYKGFILGLQAGNQQNNSWTRNTPQDLLTWKWKLTQSILGLGLTWKEPGNNWLLTGEYKLSRISVDSSKFIDNRFAFFTSINHIAGVGAEVYFSDLLTFRSGLCYSTLDYDPIMGGREVANYIYSIGCSFILFRYILEFSVLYEKSSLANDRMFNKLHLNIGVRNFSL